MARDSLEGDEGETTLGDGTHSRRQLLKVGGVVGLVAAGGFGLLQFQPSESSDGGAETEGVPEGAEFVALGDTAELLSDESFQQTIDEEFERQGLSNSTTFPDILDSIERVTGVSPDAVETTTAFATVTDTSGAVILESTVDANDISAQLEQDGLLIGHSEHRGYDVYTVGEDSLPKLSLADLENGTFALGTQSAVEASVDVREGETETADGNVGEALEAAAAGYLQFGFLVPEDLFEVLGLPAIGTGVVDFEGLKYGYGALMTDPVGQLSLTVQTDSSSAADEFESQLHAFRGLVRNDALVDQIDLPPSVREQLVETIAELDADADGTTVHVTLEKGFQIAAVALATLLSETESE